MNSTRPTVLLALVAISAPLPAQSPAPRVPAALQPAGAIPSGGIGPTALASTITVPPDLAVSVKDHGALGNGIADDSTAIQSAIQKVEARGGGLVFFPAGRYRTTRTLRVSGHGVALGGVGAASVIAPAGSFDTILIQSTTGSYLFDDRVSDLLVDESQKTGGRLLVGNYLARFISERLIADSGWSGMAFDNFNNITLYHPRLTNYRGGAGAAYVRLTGGAGGVGRSDVAFIMRSVFGGALSPGMRGLDIDGFVHTVNGWSCHFVNIGGEALHARNTIGAPDVPAFLTMGDFESDYSQLEAVRLDAALRVSFTNMQIHGARSRAGIYVGNGVKTCSFTGGFVSGSQQAGIAIAGQDVTVNGACFLANSSDQFAGGLRTLFPGILIGGTSRGVVVTGCRSGDVGSADFQRNGCQIDTGADEFVVTGNNFRNNASPGVLNGAGTGASKLVASNI